MSCLVVVMSYLVVVLVQSCDLFLSSRVLVLWLSWGYLVLSCVVLSCLEVSSLVL
jgi:hypothetical protein